MPELEYLYTLKVTRLEMLTVGSTEEEEHVVTEHFNHLKSLLWQGSVILVGRTQTQDANTFGMVVFRAKSEAEASEMMNSDPAVVHGVMQAELYPYRVALMEGRSAA